MENYSELVLAMDACADRLEFLNEAFPALATPITLDGVVNWRKRRAPEPMPESGDKSPQGQQADIDIGSVAIGLLKQHSLEDVLDLLLDNYSVELSLPELIRFVGKQAYLGALKRDVNELLKNAISFEQIAALWNDLDRPSFSDDAWNSISISTLAG